MKYDVSSAMNSSAMMSVLGRQCGTIKRHQQERLWSSADERLVIEHYFELRGLRYDTIVHSLGECNGIYMNQT